MILGWTFEQRDFSQVQTNFVGQRFIDVVPKVQKKVKGAFKYLTLANLAKFEEMGNRHSKVYPLWVVFDSTETIVNDLERNAMYCYMEKIPMKAHLRSFMVYLKKN